MFICLAASTRGTCRQTDQAPRGQPANQLTDADVDGSRANLIQTVLASAYGANRVDCAVEGRPLSVLALLRSPVVALPRATELAKQ